jgi:hypothetical protein
MVKALAEFKFRLLDLDLDFYGTKRLWWGSVIYDNVLCPMYYWRNNADGDGQ